jgi:hypothetical protein
LLNNTWAVALVFLFLYLFSERSLSNLPSRAIALTFYINVKQFSYVHPFKSHKYSFWKEALAKKTSQRCVVSSPNDDHLVWYIPANFMMSRTKELVILFKRLEPAAFGCTAEISPDRPIPWMNLSKKWAKNWMNTFSVLSNPMYKYANTITKKWADMVIYL